MAEVLPSILSADFANLGRDVRVMEEAGAQILHVDVMDGHFVPNLTIGLPVVESLEAFTDLRLDVHLMISNPDEMAARFVQAGADSVSVHYETTAHLDRLLESLREMGASAGVALNPQTPVSVLEDLLPKCDYVVLMSVNPGFGGQEFIGYSFDKVQKLRTMAADCGHELIVQIDGGIDLKNVAQAVEAGVDWIVSGSAIFGSESPRETFRKMQQIASGMAVCT